MDPAIGRLTDGVSFFKEPTANNLMPHQDLCYLKERLPRVHFPESSYSFIPNTLDLIHAGDEVAKDLARSLMSLIDRDSIKASTLPPITVCDTSLTNGNNFILAPTAEYPHSKQFRLLVEGVAALTSASQEQVKKALTQGKFAFRHCIASDTPLTKANYSGPVGYNTRIFMATSLSKLDLTFFWMLSEGFDFSRKSLLSSELQIGLRYVVERLRHGPRPERPSYKSYKEWADISEKRIEERWNMEIDHKVYGVDGQVTYISGIL